VPHVVSAPAPALVAAEQLSPAEDRDWIDRELADFLGASRRRFGANPHLATLLERSSAFVLQGGKRVRPRLCLASYRILSGRDTAPRPVVLAAASLELFHAFMLVHDDLIDESTSRRDRPTLHEALRLEADDPADTKTAGDLALLGGDLLFSLGMRLVARSGLEDATLGRAQRLLADMLFETGLGEALDVLYGAAALEGLSETQILEAYLRKTARYTVSGPLVLGATLAGAPAAVCKALGRCGDLLGLAYQIQNDLDDLVGADPSTPCSDLDGGKRTLVLWTAYRRLNAAGREAMAETLGWPAGSDRRRRLLHLIHASGATDVCLARVHALRREAAARLRSAPLSHDRIRDFHALLAWCGAAPLPAAEPAAPGL
jgi:geranylgeranyl diphosphate synthase type I